jgi:hypothetical protein
MADAVEQADIRGLDIEKAVKGFALDNYTFKAQCTQTSTTGDSIRWYQETAADLTATAPSVVANVSPLSVFPTLEVTWTRTTSYVRKYAAEGFLSLEDMKSADVDVLARTLLRLTRAVVKQVDTRIYDVITEATTSGTPNPTNVQTFATTAIGGDQWDAASAAADIIKDLIHAKKLLFDQNYNPEGASLIINPVQYRDMLAWLIGGKGSSIPQFASEKVRSGVVMQLLGLNVIVSNNAVTDWAVIMVPQQACTWKTLVDTTARVIEDPGIGSKVRVWEIGEAILTDPKAVVVISDTVS